MSDPKITEVLFGGGAGCFVAGTKVLTNFGHKNIEDIKINDIVYSLNTKENILEEKKVLHCFCFGGSIKAHKLFTFILKNGERITCTDNHEFRFENKWIEARDIARRKMETSSKHRGEVFCFEQGEAFDKKVEGIKIMEDNEASIRRKRLFKNNDFSGRKDKKRCNTSVGCKRMDEKPEKPTTSKSYRFQSTKQCSGKPRVVYRKRKLSTFYEKRKDEVFSKKCRENGKPAACKGFRGRDINSDREKSQGNSREIYPAENNEKNVGEKIRSFTRHNKGHYSKKKLEACEIRLSDIVEIKTENFRGNVYDLTVEDNHNYIVSEDNIVVHNSAKSFLGCAWLVVQCLRYNKSRWIMGRAVLKRLKETTLKTFFEVCTMWGLKADEDFKFNAMDGTIRFANGSEILLKDLGHYPSDPNYDSLGSLEITGAFIDEANEVKVKAKNIVGSRIRYKLDEFGITPKLLMTCNPAKNWAYSEFYKAKKNGTIAPHREFIQALVQDNPFISSHYIENLKKLDKNSRERLYHGNWEYDDDPSKLYELDEINDLFTNTPEASDEKFISVDVARFGTDKTVIVYWKGLEGFIKHYAKKSTKEVAELITDLAGKKQVRLSKVIIDEDGIGGGVVDQLDGVKGFLNGSKAIQPYSASLDETMKKNYGNLKAQCAFKLQEYMRAGKIRIHCDDEAKQLLIEELEQIKEKDIDKDNKIYLESKSKIKEDIGRSPDFFDAIMMRMYFELQEDIELEFFEF